LKNNPSSLDRILRTPGEAQLREDRRKYSTFDDQVTLTRSPFPSLNDVLSIASWNEGDVAVATLETQLAEACSRTKSSNSTNSAQYYNLDPANDSPSDSPSPHSASQSHSDDQGPELIASKTPYNALEAGAAAKTSSSCSSSSSNDNDKSDSTSTTSTNTATTTTTTHALPPAKVATPANSHRPSVSDLDLRGLTTRLDPAALAAALMANK
jgi:transcription elongation factor